VRAPWRIVTATRAAALLGMLAAGFLFMFVTGPTAFGLSRTDLPPLTWTDPAVVAETLGLAEGGNAFQLDTAPLEAALRALPAVAAADVAVVLPDARVVVTIEERQPVVAWQIGQTRFIADRDGKVFATVKKAASLPAGVTVIDDLRAGGDLGELAIGATIDPVEFDVATRLGSLTPTDVGSTATRLSVVITDFDGFVVSAPGGWDAVFGLYSDATRSTDMIPGQVRLLRSLIAGREETLARIVLASATDGTYIPNATPKASAR
jgi:hypothetical protein